MIAQIRAAMRERGVSQLELAQRLGISQARMSQLLSSRSNPTIKTLEKVCKALGLEIILR